MRARTITLDADWDYLPTYFPGGDKVLFNSYRTGGSDIYIADLVTGALERLTDDSRYEAHAQISPDGQHIAFVRRIGPADYDVVIRNVETRAERTLAPRPREESYPAWSPDGRYLAISSDRDSEPGSNDLYLVPVDGHDVRRLTRHPANDTYATWSADSGSIIFVSQRDGHGVYRLQLGNEGGGRCRP
jgi:Tol biopolymer transport system component